MHKTGLKVVYLRPLSDLVLPFNNVSNAVFIKKRDNNIEFVISILVYQFKIEVVVKFNMQYTNKSTNGRYIYTLLLSQKRYKGFSPFETNQLLQINCRSKHFFDVF